MLAAAAEFKPAASADHTMLGFFHRIDIAFAAPDFPCGIFAQRFSGNSVIKSIGH